MKAKIYIQFLLVFLFVSNQVASQSILEIDIRWDGIVQTKDGNGQIHQFLYFEGGEVDPATNMPFYSKLLKLHQPEYTHEVKILESEYDAVSMDEAELLTALEHDDSEIKIQKKRIISRKEHYLNLSFIPIIKSSDGYQKLTRIKLRVDPTTKNYALQAKPGKDFKEQSVLAQGDWWKMSTTQTGIHQLTYDDLAEMGVDVDNIDPAFLAIYGNGAGMLPEEVGAPRHDDLVENAIYVSGDSDGSFDPEDYILFFGQSPTVWKENKFKSRFDHRKNVYTDRTYYFLTIKSTAGKRLSTISQTNLQTTDLVTSYNDFALHEEERINILESGKVWLGEIFSNSDGLLREYNFSFEDLNAVNQVNLKTNLVARSLNNSWFQIEVNDQLIDSVKITSINSGSVRYARSRTDDFQFIVTGDEIIVSLQYLPSTSTSTGWLDFIEVNVVRDLIFRGGQLSFRKTFGTNNPGIIAEYHLEQATQNTIIWEISDPLNPAVVDADFDGSQLSFKLENDTLREFVAFDGTMFFTPQFEEEVDNQNLHAEGFHDMIILTLPKFNTHAQYLSDLHAENDGLSSIIVTPEKIYNEFSSGKADVTAIRDFVKMIYDRPESGDTLKYLMLLGDGHFDNRQYAEFYNEYLPTYQSWEYLNSASSYVIDDFFGILDPGEGYDAEGTVDIGIGRLPVFSIEQADDVLHKIDTYVNNESPVLNSWKNTYCFVADDEDGNLHFKQAEELAKNMDTNHREYNINKIYLDAYNQISSPGGTEYPGASQAISDQVNDGALVVNYTGHGGATGWSGEGVLTISNIRNWKNIENLPVFVTATCEFSRFDHPSMITAGEWVFLNPDGGGIALYTTTRLAYSQANFVVNKKFIENVFQRPAKGFYRMGDLIRLTKTPGSSNTQNFLLLGNPALRISYPRHEVNTTHINGVEVQNFNDTLSALSEVTVSGHIQDMSGKAMSNFNGEIVPVIYDKVQTYSTIGNDDNSEPATFKLRNKLVHKSRVSVVNGEFEFTFLVPKDISLTFGDGKISYYAKDTTDLTSDANGAFQNFIIGGINENAAADNLGPDIELHLNDSTCQAFCNVTDESPVLLVKLFDQHGINTGYGLGHDIIAVLDGDYSNTMVLNDYFNPSLDSYKRGDIAYQLRDLGEGPHTLTVKAFDLYNNSSEATIEFTVLGEGHIELGDVKNFPNPVSDYTQFEFYHSVDDGSFEVKIEIFDIAGKSVSVITENKPVNSHIYRSQKWYRTGQAGNKLPAGMYFYRLTAWSGNNFNKVYTGKISLQ